MNARRTSQGRSASAVPPPPLEITHFEEPLLVFGDDGLHIDPKGGIARHGPRSLGTPRHPRSIRVGIIGASDGVEAARKWLVTIQEGVRGNDKHPDFPGFKLDRGFFSELSLDQSWCEVLTQNELRGILKKGKGQLQRFEEAVGLVDAKLRLLSERDLPPQYVLISLPDDLVKRCRVADYKDKERGEVHRDFRRALKAAAMRYRLPTQLLRQSTIDGRDPTPPSKIAWNFLTGLYFKAGGVPWGPVGLRAGTCYIGVSFYRQLGSKLSKMETSLVQAFDEHGEGLVLRGHEFVWDAAKEGTKSPHLTADQAGRLVEMVLDRYKSEMKQTPQRVVVHKRSRFWPEERAGFEEALGASVAQFDLMALARQSAVRLFPASKYPPLRGTRFRCGEIDFIYTTGFLAGLGEYHAMHVPTPLQIADHIGQDTGRDTLVQEVLALTKLNWNSSSFGGLQPITLKFSALVGDILREIPEDLDPLPQYKYYM